MYMYIKNETIPRRCVECNSCIDCSTCSILKKSIWDDLENCDPLIERINACPLVNIASLEDIKIAMAKLEEIAANIKE